MFQPLPTIDPDHHLSTELLITRFAAMPAPPRDHGRVTLLLARGPNETRRRLQRATLTVEGGMPGDRWAQAEAPNDELQLAVMCDAVARLVANGQSLDLFGDNLALDLDLSAAALPIGTRLHVGEALLEVTPFPHNGCAKYAARFGLAALRYISDKARRAQRLRGIYLRVVQSGAVWVDAPVSVIRAEDTVEP